MKRFLAALAGMMFSLPVLAAGGGDVTLKHVDWSFNGPFGSFDQASMQRGFQVYREVCAGCHSLKYIAFRNLADLGYSEAEIKAIAAEYDVVERLMMKGRCLHVQVSLRDRILSPYENDNAARAANNGAYPSDLSLFISKTKWLTICTACSALMKMRRQEQMCQRECIIMQPIQGI